MKRRHFITNIALSLTLPTIAMADDLVVQPLSPTSSETGMFADLANVGKYDLPKILERFQLENNLLVNLWIPSNVQELRPIIFSHSEFSSPKNYYNLL